MGIQHHLLRLSRIGADEHLLALGQAGMCDLDGLEHAAPFDLLLTSVELAGINWLEQQRHEGLGQLQAMRA